MSRSKWFHAFALLAILALLAPAAADAQRICFSFASENNVDGPNFHGQPLNFLFDGGPFNVDGRVNPRILVQPFCDVGGVFSRPVIMRINSQHWAYIQAPFVAGNWVHDWALKGQIVFIDAITGGLFLQIDFSSALLTPWSTGNTFMGTTATLQDSERTDPNIVFTPGPELLNIMAAAGFPAGNLNFCEDFAFTLTNIHKIGGTAPFFPPLDAAGNWLADWLADGSFSATAGF
jgi:hypothetical protein